MGMREIQVAGKTILIHEPGELCDSVTGRPLTGSWVWESAFILSDWMSTQFDFRGKSVLELGAGAGAPGLTAALLGATKVLLTDIEPLVPGLLKNVEVNGLADQVQVRELMWGSDQSNQLSELNEFDVVLMSDVFYDPEEMVGLGKTLRRMCTKETMILAASEVRLSTDECLNDLASQGFRVVELHNQLSSSVGNRNLEVYAIYQLTAPDKDVDHVSHNPPM